ncbi:MAG: arginine--tRNA ligase, partial [Clostridia bacterium]|nr:arginine--tRNA ligase [Clostridia bacterium]
MDYKKYIAEKIKVDGVSADEIAEAIAIPPNTEMGDYALPCFKFSKVLRQSPVAIAQNLAANIGTDDVI